ncbi:glycosyltransferase involved in cell wall biosynthesis [Paucimonas lemoignei]|uniref:Glycosyltransferase involved in cell wall biosynthesis n=1 Tax=Paucimonas lemoignei TaxID=29443 RepID=A0A4R3HRF7_PAULE|nr:glycosyltransferase [Paucimonas lemoignei]TCS34315.1 glycosyltransferase involved in cell wall biosynthesis [Paucimonas lemoignei]
MTRHVLHVITGLVVGGAEMALYRLIQQSQGAGYTHTVIALTPEGGMRERFAEAGIKLIVLNVRKRPISEFFHLYRLMRQLRPDIVQTWLYHADLLGGLAARLAGIRNVIWGIRTTDVNIGCARPTALVRRACAAISRWIPRTIVCVAEAARRAHALIGYDAARMVVVGNGFDLSRFSVPAEQRMQIRTQCGFTEDAVVIGTVGRFNADKDHANFVRAAGILAKRDRNLRFLMVGRNLDRNNSELMQWIGETGASDQFVLLGERADVPVCLAAMDIFCLPSRTEAFPNALGEAMATGLPCVATDVGDVAAVMGDDGVLVPKMNSAALADGVTRLLELGTGGRQSLGRRARTRIHEKYSMESTRMRFENIYANLIAGRGM